MVRRQNSARGKGARGKIKLLLSPFSPTHCSPASFAADSNVIASDSTFLQIFPERKPDRIEVGLITLKPDANPEKVRMSLELHDDFLNQDINAKAIAILSTVGLADRVDYYPEKLSGGQKQRVALA